MGIENRLGPEQAFIVDGLDWSWAFVLFEAIRGYPDYWASTEGDIWTRHKFHQNKEGEWRKLNPSRCFNGYTNVTVQNENGRKSRKVHGLILETFFGPKPDGKQGCHFPDQNRSNNRLRNLRWDTPSGNNADKRIHGTEQTGSRNGSAKLSEADIPEIRRLLESGLSMAKIGKKFNVSPQPIWEIANRRGWTHV